MGRSNTTDSSSNATTRARLEGTTVAGGELSRRRFSKLLGVAAGRGRGLAVRAVAWVSDHVEVEVEQPEAERVIFTLARAEQERPCFLQTPRLSMYYRGERLDPVLEAAVRAVAPRALARAGVEELAALIGADPDAGRAGEPLPETPAGDQEAYDERALLATWGSPAVWSSFFAVAEVARSQLDSLDFFDRCTFVQHCDLECLCVNPQLGVPSTPVVLYPWEDRVRRLDWREEQELGRDEARSQGLGMVTTDLDERDVILGRGPQKLAAALDHLRDQPLGAMVFCSSTCVPVVAGEDMESVVDRHRGDLPVPVLYLTTTPQSMQGVFRDLLVRQRLEAEAAAEPPDPRAINLFGFPEEPALAELRALLAALGVTVNVALLPALAPEMIDRLPRAGLTVIHPNELWRGHYDQLLFDSRSAVISPQAPFGVEGTVAWLRAVASELELGGALSTVVEPALGQIRPQWEAQRAEAAAHTLGFVIADADARHLADPAQSWGIPLLAMVEEMGFSVEVFLGESSAGSWTAAAESIAEASRQPAELEVIRFRDRDQLRAHLGQSRSAAVYSEHFFDRRLTESGHATFNGQHLEHGLAGAVRSQRRLLELCRLPFFRRYGRLLERSAVARGLPAALGAGGDPDNSNSAGDRC